MTEPNGQTSNTPLILAILSIVLGIASWFMLGIVLSLAALVLGITAGMKKCALGWVGVIIGGFSLVGMAIALHNVMSDLQ